MVLNIDENFRIENELIQLKAIDYDLDENITYSIVGENRRKFSIDSVGRVFIAKNFDFTSNENNFMYNITIMAVDKSGRSNFTNLVLNLNVTLPMNHKNYDFECLTGYSRSELNQNNKQTLNPPLVVGVNFLHDVYGIQDMRNS